MFFRSTTQIARIARPMAARGYADKSTSSNLPASTRTNHLLPFLPFSPAPPAIGEKVGETVKKVAQSFSADGGAVGSKFRADGEIGQVGEKIGGTFSAKQGGAVGSAFEKGGAIGGTGQKVSDEAWDAGKEMKGEPIKGKTQ